jgi:AraC-like DNA-binding protein
MSYKFFFGYFFCLFFGFSNLLTAQPNEKLDYQKVKKQYIDAKDDTQRLKITAKYLKNAKDQKSWDDVARGYILFIDLNVYIDNNIALKYNDSVKSIINKISSKETIGFYYYKQGILFSAMKKHEDAIKSFNYNIVSNLKNRNYYLSKFEIAIIKTDYLEQHKEANKLFLESLDYFSKNLNENNINKYLHSLFCISLTYRELNLFKESKIYNIKGFNESIKYKEEYFKNIFRVNQATIIYKENPTVAIDSLKKSYKFIRQIKDDYLLFWYYYYNGMAQNVLKNNKEMIVNFRLVDSIYNVNKSIIVPKISLSYKHLINYSKEQKDYQKQLYYTNQLLEIDSTFAQDYKLIINKLQKEYDLPQLTKDKEELIQKLENKGTTKVYIIIILGILVLLAVGYATKTHKEKNEIKKLLHTIQEKTEVPVLTIDDEIIDGEIIDGKRVDKERKDEEKIDEKRVVEKIIDKGQEKDIKTSETIVLSEKIIKNLTLEIELFEKELGFLDNKINMIDLAKKMNSNSKYLSLYLNRYGKGIKFNEYINELRINYIVKKITKNPKMINYTIEAIAIEAGFNNASTFANAFKAKLDVLPSEYLEYLKKSKKAS